MPDEDGLPEPLPAGYQLDRFTIEAELPSGEMGRVYRAFDSVLHETMAVNVLSRDLRDVEGVRAFRFAFYSAFKAHRDVVLSYCEYAGVPYCVVDYSAEHGAAIDVAAYRAGARGAGGGS